MSSVDVLKFDGCPLSGASICCSDDEKVLTQQILEKEGLTNYQLGKSKVFLRAGQMAQLDNRRAEVLNSAARMIQRKARSFLGRRWFVRMRQATMTIQRHYRGKSVEACLLSAATHMFILNEQS